MKLKSIQFISIFIIILFSLSLFSVTADKIQLRDTWEYIDNRDNTYNETATDIIQVVNEDTGQAISTVSVDTDRNFNYFKDINYTNNNYILDINITFGDGLLYLTQEGGLPLFKDANTTGNVYLYHKSNNSLVDQLIINNAVHGARISWEIVGTPSKAFATAESEFFSVKFDFYDYATSGTDTMGVFKLTHNYVISTNQVVSNMIRNYTISLISTNIYLDFFTPNGIETSFDTSNNLSNSQFSNDESLMITWDSQYKIPTYIRASEPANIRTSSIGLSQASNVIEYFLVLPNQSPTGVSDTEDTTYFITFALLSIATLVMAKPRLKRVVYS